MSRAWVYLVIAGLLEFVWAVGLKQSQGFTRPLPSTVTVVAAPVVGVTPVASTMAPDAGATVITVVATAGETLVVVDNATHEVLGTIVVPSGGQTGPPAHHHCHILARGESVSAAAPPDRHNSPAAPPADPRQSASLL